jgi:hypothetical protein
MGLFGASLYFKTTLKRSDNVIYTDVIVTISGNKSTVSNRILLYRGDRELEISFQIQNQKFRFSNNIENLISSTDAAFGQLVIKKPNGEKILSDISKCDNGKVIFLITKEMIDDLVEVGFYDIQIRLYDNLKTARITIPPVVRAIEVKEPMVVDDHIVPPEDKPITFTYDASNQELIINNADILYNAENEELFVSDLILKEE